MQPTTGKVLFLVNAFPSPDNSKKSPFNLRALKSLIAAGVDIQAIHLRSWAPKRKQIQQYDLDGVPVTAVCLPFYVKLPAPLAAFNLWVYKKLFASLVGKIIDLHSVRIIHSVGAGHAGVVGSELSRRYRIPHLVQCIGSDINLVIPSMKDHFGVKGWEKYVDNFPCNSVELANQVHSLYPSAKTEVIYRGVNLKEFYPDRTKRSADKMVFTYIGGFTPKETKPFGIDQKGGVTVLKAWRKLAQTGYSDRITLKFGGPAVNRATVEANYKGSLDADGIEVVGQLSKQDVCPLLQSSNVVLIPSMFEGLPNAAMEASAAGAALVGSRVGGIPEVIREGETGFIVERKNAQELADRMLRLIEHPDLVEQMGREGRAFMEQRFDAAQFAKGYTSLYEKTLKGS